MVYAGYKMKASKKKRSDSVVGKGSKPGAATVGSMSPFHHSKKLMIVMVGVVVLAAITSGGVYFYSQKHSQQQAKAKNPAEQRYNNFINSPAYQKANQDQKLSFRLNVVSQYLAVSAYQKMLDELAKIQKDLPGSQNNVDYLMYGFIAYHGLGQQEQATNYAKKIKATSPTLPEQFKVWQSLVDKNAAQ